MGILTITTRGSFRPGANRTFSAQGNGHAHAVAQAIQWLSTELLPEAIAQDHELHAQGAKPTNGYGKPRKDSANG